MTKICICGGGSLGHVCAGVLSSMPDVQVNIHTRRPEDWSDTLIVTDCDGKKYIGHPSIISADEKTATNGCDIVFLCLPGFAIEEELRRIKPYLGPDTVVGSIVSSTGFFFAAHDILGKDAKLFGFQRAPFIARLTEYGRSANLLGYKSQLAIAIENIQDRDAFRALVEKLWLTPVKILNNYYEAALTNSNPILHPARLYSMWKDWNGELFDHNIFFYSEWNDDASRLLIAMDDEFQSLLKRLPVTSGAIPTLLDYYECTDAPSLAAKIRSIPAFKNILAPMKQVEGGWIPDFTSRYFTEDFPFGLGLINNLIGVESKWIRKVYEWGMSKILL